MAKQTKPFVDMGVVDMTPLSELPLAETRVKAATITKLQPNASIPVTDSHEFELTPFFGAGQEKIFAVTPDNQIVNLTIRKREGSPRSFFIQPGMRAGISTGLGFLCELGYSIQVLSYPTLAFSHGIEVIASSFIGEARIVIANRSTVSVEIKEDEIFAVCRVVKNETFGVIND